MMPIKAIIVDDEQHCVDALTTKLKEYCPEVTVLTGCTDISVAMKAIQDYSPDIVFLDINMPGEDGFSLLEKIGDITFEIIFTTAYDKYAVKAFEFNALHYLLKPINGVELQAALKRYAERNVHTSVKEVLSFVTRIHREQRSIDKLAIPVPSGYQFVELKNIVRLQAMGNYTAFYFGDCPSIKVAKTLKEYEDLLADESFVRVHASHLVNLHHVKEYRKVEGNIVMSDGTTIEVSVRKKALFLEKIGKILKL